MSALAGRVAMMLGRGVIGRVDDSTQAQTVQIELLADEAQEAERFQDYGFTSVPHDGAEAVMAAIGGLRSHGIIIAVVDRRFRLKGLAAGEVAIHDDQGQIIHLKRTGIVIKSQFKVCVEAPIVEIEADTVNLGGAGGAKVARVGDTVAGGIITSGSDKVKAA